jgi:hypothetical protein
LVPFHTTVIAGYNVGYNLVFGLVHSRFAVVRPSDYFFEPSYLAFFLGFSFFYLIKADWIKRKNMYCFFVCIAGILTGSYTFYVSTIMVLLIMFFHKFIPKQLKDKFYNWYLIGFVILSIFYLSNFGNVSGTILSSFKTSFSTRKERIVNSVNLIKSEKPVQLILGSGPGSIAKSRALGESNAYVKLLIEEGLITLVAILILIYYSLRKNQFLLLFSLFALHSVVLIETPLFIFLLLISSIFAKLYYEPDKYKMLLLNPI